MDFFALVEQAGFPIALAVVCGWFIQQAIKLVLGSVVKSIKKLTGLIRSMDGRVRQMNTDVLDLDKLVSSSLYVDPLPVKVHHEVAAVMNSDGPKPPEPPKSKPPSIIKKITDVIDDAVEKVEDVKGKVEEVKDKVEKLGK